MENTQIQRSITPAFHTKPRKPHKKSDFGSEEHESSSSFRRSRRKKSRHYILNKTDQIQKKDEVFNEEEEEDDDEKEEVERKIEALQRIVPGGESLGPDKIFEQTAGYILSLQCQVKAMKALSSFFEALQRDTHKKTRF